MTTAKESLFPSLRSMRQKAEDRAQRYDQLAKTDEQYLALVKVNPHVFLALLDVVEAAQALDKTWKAHGFTHNHIPDALVLSEALEPLVSE